MSLPSVTRAVARAALVALGLAGAGLFQTQPAAAQLIAPPLAQLPSLVAPEGAADDKLGWSVAASGDTLVIGAYLDDAGANADQGSAYVFVRSGGVWSFQQKLVANDGAAQDRFGDSVAIIGDTIVVGAPLDDIGANLDQGSAYVFVRSGTGWAIQQKLTANDGAAQDRFGDSVAIYADTVVAGAPLDNTATNSDQGAAYVFARSGAVWSQRQKLSANDGAPDDQFGGAVAISDNTIVVGAYLDDNTTPTTGQEGAYVFARSGNDWSFQQKLVASDGAEGDHFGAAVAVSGDMVVIGAWLDDNGPNTDQGAAYVFARSGTSWTQQRKLTANDGRGGDRFGRSVALDGNTALIGAYL
ncbi:MAG: FG-GAP repeat protein, partial [Blastocatellia bacterium]